MVTALNLPLKYGTHEVRTVGSQDRPEWVAADVCAVLGLRNVGQALASIPDDERGATFNYVTNCDVSERLVRQRLVTVTEAGLYRLLFKSRKPEAEAFKKWVFNDVLPCIRRHGTYPAPLHPAPNDVERLLGQLEHMQQQLDRLTEQRALAAHIPTSATPRTTVQERLRFKGWPQATKKQRAVVRRQANIWLDLRYNETPDVSGGPGGACLYFGHQIVVLDEAIDYVRDAVANRGRDAKRYRNGDLVETAA